MPKVPEGSADVEAGRRVLQEVHTRSCLKIREHLAGLDPADAGTLSFLVEALLMVHFEPAYLSEILGVSRTTIGRWVQGQNVPRSPGYRQWVVEMLKEKLDETINGSSEIALRAPKTKRRAYLTS
jgi:hypothetical protein